MKVTQTNDDLDISVIATEGLDVSLIITGSETPLSKELKNLQTIKLMVTGLKLSLKENELDNLKTRLDHVGDLVDEMYLAKKALWLESDDYKQFRSGIDGTVDPIGDTDE